MSVLYHGGVPDLKPGDTIEPGHSRDNYDDCPICRARREKGASAIEGTGHQEQVYCTTMRDYAAEYAAIYGKGDVYQVRPIATSSNPMRISKAVTDATGCKSSEQWRNTSC